ncbi:MAG: DHH family phosphoesterase [Clostridiales bacterium]|jgi:phosphoglycolate phosphatase|nr:DHH family phosphoesterase [Clostridiales bacterium]
MDLKDFLEYKKIALLCHNIPDADTVGSAFALGQYLTSLGAEVILIYGGWEKISKPSLVMMIDNLNIEIQYTKEFPTDVDALITVDCQYGAGNVQKYELPGELPVFAIDHHRAEIAESERTNIQPQLGACATLVWDLLRRAGFDIDGDYRVLNALYYALYSDTNGLAELRHPLDRDLADLRYDRGLIRKLRNSAITIEELHIVGDMLKNREIRANIGLFASEPCDPNLLGFASDIAQQTAKLDCCVMFSRQNNGGLKLSIRSSAREIMANEIAEFLCRGVGGGGGNLEKAGGFLGGRDIERLGTGETPEEYLGRRTDEYLANYDHIYAGETPVDFASMPLYRKLTRRVGYARSIDIFPDKTKMTIRTLEGDIDIVAAADIYLMIGVLGEVYPIKRETFEKSYNAFDEPFGENLEYVPTVIDRMSGDKHKILPCAKSCVPRGEKLIRAAELERDTKVFTRWDTEKYFCGVKGDFLAANDGVTDDCYVIRRDIFLETYERIYRDC